MRRADLHVYTNYSSDSGTLLSRVNTKDPTVVFTAISIILES
jgi:hypothetical protein